MPDGTMHRRKHVRPEQLLTNISLLGSQLLRCLQASYLGTTWAEQCAEAYSFIVPSAPILSGTLMSLTANELVTNALKYAFPGERPGLVQVQFGKQGDGLCLSVADDGVGCMQESVGLGTNL